jgi:hypothetical protein
MLSATVRTFLRVVATIVVSLLIAATLLALNVVNVRPVY